MKSAVLTVLALLLIVATAATAAQAIVSIPPLVNFGEASDPRPFALAAVVLLGLTLLTLRAAILSDTPRLP